MRNRTNIGLIATAIIALPRVAWSKRISILASIEYACKCAIIITALIFAACDNGSTATNNNDGGGTTTNQTPAAADFNISGLSHIYDGSPKTVTVTPKQGKSGGTVTVYYAGASGTSYAKNTTAPSAIGTYTVTFDVEAATGWKAATGLSAGTLTIAQQTANAQTPTAADFTIGNVSQTAGNVTGITITPKQGKSQGQITIYYNGSTTIPQTAGNYPVTFNVAAADGWNAVTGLSAGTLSIAQQTANAQTPTAADFTIGNLSQAEGNVTPVTIGPKAGKSQGQITILYNGSTTIPQTAGNYPVTFNVAAADGWNAATGLSAGTLSIAQQTAAPQTPTASDFTVSGLSHIYDGSPKTVTITPKQGKSTGAITVSYDGSETAPSAIGTYPVTFNVAAATGWNAVTGLSAGTLVIANQTANQQNPIANDFTIGNLTQTAGSVTAVTISPKQGKSQGQITIYYNGSTTIPQTSGNYSVTFNVATADGWNAATGLSAGMLTISEVTTTYTVTYNANGGSGTAPAAQTVNEGSSVTLADGSGFIKPGYTFDGWNTDASGMGAAYGAGAFYTPSGTITLFAKWNANQYTVTYNANGGTGSMANTSFTFDVSQNLRTNVFNRSGYVFDGWSTSNSGTTVYTDKQSVSNLTTMAGATVTLYAVWSTIVPGSNLAAKLTWLQTNAISNLTYTVEVNANESISPRTLSYSGKTNIGIILVGVGTTRTISLSSNGSMFTIASGVTLILDNNITLQGRSNNNDSLVKVNSGGYFEMRGNTKISGNTTSSSGSSSSAPGSGTSTGSITGSSNGGGVYVEGSFTMKGSSSVSGNTATSSAYSVTTGAGSGIGSITIYHAGSGGGVYVAANGVFIMQENAQVSNNNAKNTQNTLGSGGGVYLARNSTFRISGGTISGNTGSSSASSLFVTTSGTTAVYGVFNGDTFTSYGTLSSTSNTINVVNGNVQ